MGNLYPSVGTVIQRALALQLVIDRGWTENNIINNIDKEKSEEIRRTVLNWNQSEGISKWLTDKEKDIWEKKIGGLTKEEIACCTWRLEALVPLLWALGLRDMPNYSMCVEDNHYSVLHYCDQKPMDKILFDIKRKADDEFIIKPSEIKIQADLHMLVNWCCVEFLMCNNKKINMFVKPREIFGEEIDKTVELLTLNNKGDLIIPSHSLVFKDMRKYDVGILQLIVENRQHALNWLIGQDENWDDVTTDT